MSAYEICELRDGGPGCYVKAFFDEWGPLVYIAVALIVAAMIAGALRSRKAKASTPEPGPSPPPTFWTEPSAASRPVEEPPQPSKSVNPTNIAVLIGLAGAVVAVWVAVSTTLLAAAVVYALFMAGALLAAWLTVRENAKVGPR